MMLTQRPPASPVRPSPELEIALIYGVVVLIAVVVLLAIWVFRLRRRLPEAEPGDRASDRAGDREFGPSSVISPAEAQAGAQRGIEAYGLLSRSDWQRVLSPPARALQPILVLRLDATELADAYYYLVPFGPSDEAVGAVVRVDGVSGEYLEANAFAPTGSTRSWGSMIADWRSEGATRRRIASRTRYRGTFAADPHGIGIHPSLVWRPCVESRSPYYPFRLVSIGDERRYVRIDGEEFESLTDIGPVRLVDQP